MSTDALAPPGQGRGLLDVWRNRYLLRLIVRKEVQVRYRGSVLGILWSYIKPAIQFVVFYIAMGVFLGLNKGMSNYAVYLFSGIVVMNFFNETFGNAARSVVGNGQLIKKIYLPRELFPVSSLWVAVVHFVPQLLVLLVACFVVGWRPGLLHLAAIAAGFTIVAVFALGLGLVFTTANVFFRDAENIVDLIAMVATWASPVLYLWTMVRDESPGWLLTLYLANPLTVAVELFHYGFWVPTTDNLGAWQVPPHLFSVWTPLALAIAAALVVVGDAIFRRYEGHFAQEL
ncbi:MAG: ABC transporter permease [Propionibacteriaceae bacterium]|nr:ABC transporter permease [Propionibacteriaceae bacterium]